LHLGSQGGCGMTKPDKRAPRRDQCKTGGEGKEGCPGCGEKIGGGVKKFHWEKKAVVFLLFFSVEGKREKISRGARPFSGGAASPGSYGGAVDTTGFLFSPSSKRGGPQGGVFSVGGGERFFGGKGVLRPGGPPREEGRRGGGGGGGPLEKFPVFFQGGFRPSCFRGNGENIFFGGPGARGGPRGRGIRHFQNSKPTPARRGIKNCRQRGGGEFPQKSGRRVAPFLHWGGAFFFTPPFLKKKKSKQGAFFTIPGVRIGAGGAVFGLRFVKKKKGGRKKKTNRGIGKR